MAKDITCRITKEVAVLSENDRGYIKEANFVSWNGGNAKLDIREWHPGRERSRLLKRKAENLWRRLSQSIRRSIESNCQRRYYSDL